MNVRAVNVLKLLIISVVAVGFATVSAADWEKRVSHNGYALFYSKKENKVQVRRNRILSKKTIFTFDVSAPSLVEQAQEKFISYFGDGRGGLKWNQEDMNEFLNFFEQIKFLSTRECRVIHINLKDPLVESSLGPLMDSLDKMALENRVDIDSDRSFAVLDVDLPDEELKLQIRTVVNARNEISKISIVNRTGDLKGYEVKKNEVGYSLVSEKGESILVINLLHLHDGQGKIILIKKANDGIENVTREHFALRKHLNNWTMRKYATSSESPNLSKDGVPLTTIHAKHHPVAHISSTDTFFPLLTEEESIAFMKEYYNFEEVELTDQIDKLNEKYKQCMLEQYLVRKNEELDVSDEKIKNTCIRYGLLEISVDIMKSYAESILENEPELVSENKKSFENCITSSQFYKKYDGYVETNFNQLMTKEKSAFASVLSSCISHIQVDIGKTLVTESLSKDDTVKFHVNSDVILKSLKEDVLSRGYEKCLEYIESNHFQKCLGFSRLVKISSVSMVVISEMLAESLHHDKDLFNKSRLEIFSGPKGLSTCEEKIFEKYLKELKEGIEINRSQYDLDELECLKKAFLKMQEKLPDSYFVKGVNSLKFFESRNVKVDKNLLLKAREEMMGCLAYEFDYEESLDDFIKSIERKRSMCMLSGVKKIIPELYIVAMSSKIDEFVKSSEEKEAVEKLVKRMVKKDLEDRETLSDLDSILMGMEPGFYAIVLDFNINAELNRRFAVNGAEAEINKKVIEEIKKRLLKSLGMDSNQPIKENMQIFLKRVSEREKIENALGIRSHDIIKSFHQTVSPFIVSKEIYHKLLVEEERDQLAKEIDDEFQKCLSSFKANSGQDFQKHLLKCEKVREGAKIFLLAKRNFTREVSQTIALKQYESNEILLPIHYMSDCIEDPKYLESDNVSLNDFIKRAEACVVVTKLDISANVLNYMINKPEKEAQKNGQYFYRDRSMHPQTMAAYCYNIMISMDFYKEAKKVGVHISGDSRSRDMLGDEFVKMHFGRKHSGSLLSSLKTGHMGYYSSGSMGDKVNDLLNAIVKSENLTLEKITERTYKCESDAVLMINMAKRKFYADSILQTRPGGEIGKEIERIIYDFLDVEMIQLLEKFTKVKENLASGLTGQSAVPGERYVTPELGQAAMRNFIQHVGDLIKEGLVYDLPQMKTELMIFQVEMKEFLKMYIKRPDLLKVNDTREFFKESKLSDHLALAIISKRTRLSFYEYVEKTKKEEYRQFWAKRPGKSQRDLSADDKTEYKRIGDKATELNNIIREMTRSKEFRRIFKPETILGERNVTKIVDNYLLPLVFNGEVSDNGKQIVDNIAYYALKGDSTEDGFADKFAGAFAEYYLSNRWDGLRWYNSFDWWTSSRSDYRWSKLRETEKGQKALRYLFANIIYPEVFQHRDLSQTEWRQRRKKFEDLVKDAL